MKKIQSTAMYYALFLSVIFALLLGGFILFSGFNQNFAMQMDVEETLMDNANSGIAYAQANYRELQNNVPIELRLFGEGIDSVQLTKKNWGAFIVIESTAIHKNKRSTKLALLGASSTKKQPNLYIPDNGKPISICGETRIEGQCFLPKTGLKRAYIDGKNYQGERLIFGTVAESEKQLPPVQTSFFEAIEVLGGNVQEWDQDVDSLSVSFGDEAVHLVADGFMNLSKKVIRGQLLLEAKDSIFVGKDTQLENAILKSKIVYIEAGFSGTVQIFATEKIILEDFVLLKYPSVLGMVETEFPTLTAMTMEIGEKSQVIGSVFLISKSPNFRLLPALSIATSAEVDGLVYCEGKTQLKGIIKGSLFTEKLFLKTASSAYENHLLDAQILDQLPERFIAANLLEETTLLKRIAWLN
jgi:hypothetical protein